MFNRHSGAGMVMVLSAALTGVCASHVQGQETATTAPSDDPLKWLMGGPEKPDQRALAVEAERKALANVKKDDLEKAQRAYVVKARDVGYRLAEEFKVDDALMVWQGALLVDKGLTNSVVSTQINHSLARVKAIKAMKTRIAPTVRALAKDRDNQANVQLVVEALVVEAERFDLALKVAQEGKSQELAEKVKKMGDRHRGAPSNMEDLVATGDWMVDIAKRTPAIKDLACTKAYAAYADGLGFPDVPIEVRKRVYKTVKAFPLSISNAGGTNAGLLRVDVSVSGNAQVDSLLEGLEPELVPEGGKWKPEQSKALSELIAKNSKGKQGVAFRGQLVQVSLDPKFPPNAKDGWKRTIQFTTRFGHKGYVVFFMSKKSLPVPIDHGTLAVSGDVANAWFNGESFSFRLEEAKLLDSSK